MTSKVVVLGWFVVGLRSSHLDVSVIVSQEVSER